MTTKASRNRSPVPITRAAQRVRCALLSTPNPTIPYVHLQRSNARLDNLARQSFGSAARPSAHVPSAHVPSSLSQRCKSTGSSSDQFIRSVHQIILHAMRSEGMRSEGHSIQQPPRIKLGSTHPNNAWSKPHPEIRRRQPSITLPATFSRTVAPSFGTPLDPPGTFWPHSRLQATHRSDQKSLR